MEITNYTQIDGAVARRIRHDLGRSQEVFWGAVGVKRDTGNTYERVGRIPEPVRRLLFMRYIVGIPVDAPPDELDRIGRLARADKSATETLLSAATQFGIAATHIKTAVEAILKKESQTWLEE